MFPFRFDYLDKSYSDRHEFYKQVQFDKRINLEKLYKILGKNDWEYKKFLIEDHKSYNEVRYFHDFVKDALYNFGDNPKISDTSSFFEKNIKDKFYIIQTKNKYFKLDLQSINLRIFDTGIGILSFEVENNRYCDFEDILKINEYGRRIYPQFVDEGFRLEYVFGAGLAKNLTIADKEIDFEKLNKETLQKNEILPKEFLEILGENFTQNIKETDKFLIQPILDDRMFVMSWYGDDELSNQLSKKSFYHTKDMKIDDIFDNWYRYTFVDSGDKTIQDDDMEIELIKKSTYIRWKKYGTLYGISRYSFMMLTNRNWFATNILLTHFKTMYYQMVILCLTQRATILRFSDEVTAISDLDGKDNLSSRVSNLYKNYLRFVNKLYFREVTAQEQGIELYDKIIQNLNIDKDVKDLDNEIKNLNDYVQLRDSQKENKEMAKLTKVATWFMPPTLVVGFFGMNIFNEDLFAKLDFQATDLLWIFILIILMIASYAGLKEILEKDKKD